MIKTQVKKRVPDENDALMNPSNRGFSDLKPFTSIFSGPSKPNKTQQLADNMSKTKDLLTELETEMANIEDELIRLRGEYTKRRNKAQTEAERAKVLVSIGTLMKTQQEQRNRLACKHQLLSEQYSKLGQAEVTEKTHTIMAENNNLLRDLGEDSTVPTLEEVAEEYSVVKEFVEEEDRVVSNNPEMFGLSTNSTDPVLKEVMLQLIEQDKQEQAGHGSRDPGIVNLPQHQHLPDVQRNATISTQNSEEKSPHRSTPQRATRFQVDQQQQQQQQASGTGRLVMPSSTRQKSIWITT